MRDCLESLTGVGVTKGSIVLPAVATAASVGMQLSANVSAALAWAAPIIKPSFVFGHRHWYDEGYDRACECG